MRAAAVEALLALRPDLRPAAERLFDLAVEREIVRETFENLGFYQVPDVGPAVRGLGSPDAQRRAEAVQSLGEAGSRAEHALARLLELVQDPDDRVRAALGIALSRIAWDDQVLGAVRALLKDDSVRVRAACAAGLARDDVDAVAALRGAIQDPAASVRRQATRALGRSGRAAIRAASDLVATLRDDDRSVRRMAFDAIGRLRLHSDRALATIVRHLDHPNDPDGHCADALRCLQRIGPDAVQAFGRVIEISRGGTLRPEIRAGAIDALWSIADDPRRGAAALRLVEAICETDEQIVTHASEILRRWVDRCARP